MSKCSLNGKPVFNMSTPTWELRHGVDPYIGSFMMLRKDAESLKETNIILKFEEHAPVPPGKTMESKIRAGNTTLFKGLVLVEIPPNILRYDTYNQTIKNKKDDIAEVVIADVRYYLHNYNKVAGWYNITNKQAYIGHNEAKAVTGLEDASLVWNCYPDSMFVESSPGSNAVSNRLYRGGDIFLDIMSKVLVEPGGAASATYDRSVQGPNNVFIAGLDGTVKTNALTTMDDQATNPIVRDFQFSGISPAEAIQQLLSLPEMANHFVTIADNRIYLCYRAETDKYEKGFKSRVPDWMKKRIDTRGTNRFGMNRRRGSNPNKVNILFPKEIRTLEQQWEPVLPADQDGSTTVAGVTVSWGEGEFVNAWTLLQYWGYSATDCLNESTLGFPSCPPIPADAVSIHQNKHRTEILENHLLKTFRMYDNHKQAGTKTKTNQQTTTIMLPINPEKKIIVYTYHYRSFDERRSAILPYYKNFGIFDTTEQYWDKYGKLVDYVAKRPVAVPWAVSVINPMEGIIHVESPPGHLLVCNFDADEYFDITGAIPDYKGSNYPGNPIGDGKFFVEYYCRPIITKRSDYHGYNNQNHVVTLEQDGVGSADYISNVHAVVDHRKDKNSDWTTAIKKYNDYDKFDAGVYNSTEIEKMLAALKDFVKLKWGNWFIGELQIAGIMPFGSELSTKIPWGKNLFDELDYCVYTIENGECLMRVKFHTTPQPSPMAGLVREISDTKQLYNMMGRW